MGCDIHPAIEYRENGSWKAHLDSNKYFGKWDGEPEFTARIDLNRNYTLFAILNNVRNRFNVVSITDSRGLPDDISTEAFEALSQEHSQTYIMLQEILDFDWDQVFIESGIINAVTFKEWYPRRHKLGDNFPKYWCGGTSERLIAYPEMLEYLEDGNVKDTEVPSIFGNEHPSTEVRWAVRYRDAVKQLFEDVLPIMQDYAAKYGAENVRIVMDFDS